SWPPRPSGGTTADQGVRPTLLRVFGVAVAGYALAAPWLPPSTLSAVRVNAQRIGGPYNIGFAQFAGLAAAILSLVAAAYALQRATLAVRFWTLSTLAFSGIALPALWFGKYLVPQPERYHLQMEMSIVGLGGVLLYELAKRGSWIRWGVYAGVSLL